MIETTLSPVTISPASSMLSYSVEAKIVDDGVSEARCKDAVIAFDSSPGQSPALPGPAELLATALAACILKNVERFAEMLHFELSGASVRVVADRTGQPPRFSEMHYVLHVETLEDARRVDLLHRNIQKYGTVYNTLAAACRISGEVVIDRPRQRIAMAS